MALAVHSVRNPPRSHVFTAEDAVFHSRLDGLPVRVVMRQPVRSGERWLCHGRLSGRTFFASRAEFVAPPSLCHRVAEQLAIRTQAGLSWCPTTASLNRSILLGAPLPHDIRSLFAAAGTVHVFAISGLHVMIVAWMIASILRRFAVRPAFVAIPLIVAYVAFTGGRPSAVRAAIMAILYFAAPVFNRRSDLATAWAITACIVYVYSPRLIFDTGCALSFVVMFGIAMYLRLKPMGESFVGETGVSFSAWLSGVPIMAHVFGRFTPGGLLANLVILKIAERAVKLGMAGMIFSILMPPVGALFNNLAAVCIMAMTQISQLVSCLPFGNFEICKWGVLPCAGWYGACAAVWYAAKNWKRGGLGW